jgi:hypothetical protein
MFRPVSCIGLGGRGAAVELTPEDATTAARTLRRWARAQGTTREVTVNRGNRRRKVRRPVRRMTNGKGFVVVNDGPSMVAYVARVLGSRGEPGVSCHLDRCGAVPNSRQLSTIEGHG